MEKKDLLYEGKAKQLFETSDPEVLWVMYKNQATAGNGEKRADITGKGELNNQITSKIFLELKKRGVESHFLEQQSMTEQTIEKVEIIPLEVVVRNVAAGSFSRRLGVEEGTELPFPIVEFYLKDDDLGDPLILEDHIRALDFATDEEVAELKTQARKINHVLIELFKEMGIKLVDFKLEFGKRADQTIVLADEISPDTCRLWDLETNDRLDKDVFRQDLGDIIPLYQEVLDRLKQLN